MRWVHPSPAGTLVVRAYVRSQGAVGSLSRVYGVIVVVLVVDVRPNTVKPFDIGSFRVACMFISSG